MQKKPAHPIPVVRLIVPDGRERILLLRRAATEFCPDMWCLPGGLVDYGETVEEAAGRELKEECGLDPMAVRFLFYQDSLPAEHGEMHGVNFYFECRTSGDLKLNDESSEHAWVFGSQLENYDLAFNNNAGLLRYFDEFRQPVG